MKPRIYVETSVVSYLAARPSRDALVNFRQTITSLWWDRALQDADLFVSGLVLTEVARGDPAAARRRMAVCEELLVIGGHDDSPALAQRLIEGRLVPSTEPEDALHIAEAKLARMDYVATWNFAHFVQVAAKYRVVRALEQWGYTPPLFATPEELLESLAGTPP